MQTHSELSSSGLEELTKLIFGQFLDSRGEGLEQREIKVDNGELYISFWNYSESRRTN